MAVANIRTNSSISNTVSIEVVGTSGSDRLVVGLFTQERSSDDIGIPTLDGVAGTQAGSTINSSNIQRITCFYWLDADIPATSGTYDIASAGLGSIMAHAIYADNVEQQANSDFASYNTDGTGTTFTLASAGTDSLIVGGLVRNASAGTTSIGGSQSAIATDTAVGSSRHISSYTATGDSHTYISDQSQPTAILAVSFNSKTAGTGPNVSTYNTDLSEKSGFQTLQVKIADADTVNGLFASDVITVEDDMLVSVETVKDGVTINLSSDGNISVDKTELDNAGGSITLNPEYFSPGTGNISTLPYTFTAPTPEPTPDPDPDPPAVGNPTQRRKNKVLRTPLKSVVKGVFG